MRANTDSSSRWKCPSTSRTKRSPTRPVVHHDFRHREVGGIASREDSADAHGRRCDQAVGLVQRDAALCVGATPGAGSLAFGHAKRSTPQPAEQLPNDRLLAEQHAAPDLLDGDGAHPRFVTAHGEADGRARPLVGPAGRR